MSNIFKAGEAKVEEVKPVSNSTTSNTTMSEPMVTEIKAPEESSFVKTKDVKCFGSIGADGKRVRCRRKVIPGSSYCTDHQPKTTDDKKSEKKTNMSPDTAVRSLMSFHLGIYLLVQEISKNTESSSLEGLTDIFQDQKKELEQIYKDIVATYGEEEVARYIGPFTALAFVSGQQVLSAYKRNKKNSSSTDTSLICT